MTEAAAAALVGTSSPQPIADTRVVVVCVCRYGIEKGRLGCGNASAERNQKISWP